MSTNNEEMKKCECGHDRTHYMVTPDGKYSGMKWFLMLAGISVTPERITYTCRRCNVTFDSTTDPAILRRRM